MSELVNDDIRITYRTQRCWACGTFYAVETRLSSSQCECPKCAREEIRKAERDRDIAKRSAASLRGILKRRGKS